jgi:hypothetical protein
MFPTAGPSSSAALPAPSAAWGSAPAPQARCSATEISLGMPLACPYSPASPARTLLRMLCTATRAARPALPGPAVAGSTPTRAPAPAHGVSLTCFPVDCPCRKCRCCPLEELAVFLLTVSHSLTHYFALLGPPCLRSLGSWCRCRAWTGKHMPPPPPPSRLCSQVLSMQGHSCTHAATAATTRRRRCCAVGTGQTVVPAGFICRDLARDRGSCGACGAQVRF